MALQCGVNSAPQSRHAVILYIDDPAAPDNQYLGDGFTVEQSLSALGPWAPAAITADSATDCVGDTSGNTIFVGGSAAGLAAIFQITALNPGTQYFFRVTHTVSGPPANNPTGQVIICDITTFAMPVLNGCVLGGPPGQTTYPGRIGTASGFVNTQPGCDQDTIQWEIATVSGGPYTPDGPVSPVNGGSPSHTFTGLTPGTTYFYRARLNNPTDGPNFATTSECSFTTLAATAVSCSPATAITQVSATLNGTGGNIPANQFVRFAWGTTLGGPYPNTTPNVAGTNVAAQAVSAPIAGLAASTPYFYVVQHLDTDGTTVLTTSTECTLTTSGAPVPFPPNAFAPRVLIDAPACAPWRFGLLSIANIIDETDDHRRNGIKYKPKACLAGVEPYVDGCDTLGNPNLKAPTDLDDQGVEVEGDPFHLYTYLSCKTTTLAAMLGEAREAFESGEQGAIEEMVWTSVLADPDCTVLNPVPGTGLPVVAAIAALESYASANYNCRPVFHSDRATVPYAVAEHQLVVVGGALSTFLGSAWAAYGNSPNTGPDGTPAPDGHAWIYMTSGFTLRRFPIDVLPESVDHILVRTADGQTNEPRVIAERTYVPSVECACAAVLVCLGC